MNDEIEDSLIEAACGLCKGERKMSDATEKIKKKLWEIVESSITKEQFGDATRTLETLAEMERRSE